MAHSLQDLSRSNYDLPYIELRVGSRTAGVLQAVALPAAATRSPVAKVTATRSRKPLGGERAWQNQQVKKTLSNPNKMACLIRVQVCMYMHTRTCNHPATTKLPTLYTDMATTGTKLHVVSLPTGLSLGPLGYAVESRRRKRYGCHSTMEGAMAAR